MNFNNANDKVEVKRVRWDHEGRIRYRDDAEENCNHEFLGNDTGSRWI